MIELQKAVIASFGLPDGTMMCGPASMIGYLQVQIPLTPDVMRLLADAMDLAKESKQ